MILCYNYYYNKDSYLMLHENGVHVSVTEPAADPDPAASSLTSLLYGLPHHADDVVIAWDGGQLSQGELLAQVDELAETLRAAGVRPGLPVGNLVAPGPSGVVAMFAAWSVGAVYVPINRRYTATETRAFFEETPLALMIGERVDLAAHDLRTGAVEYDYRSRAASVLSMADASVPRLDPGIALGLRTSGTTGRPKAVLLRHASTIVSLDASLEKLRHRKSSGVSRSQPAAAARSPRKNLIPVSLALWAGIFNTLFSFRAGFGVVMLDRFTTAGFTRAVREHHITSTVLAPAMITMLTDDDHIDDLAPLRLVRSITAPLSPAIARKFHERFGVFVLNSYGQTELGGEVVGWTTKDLREFGESKLGAAGRPYDHIGLRIHRPDGSEAGAGEFGEIFVRSPYRMEGYARAVGAGTAGMSDEDRFVDGYLRTGDIGRLDSEGFLWVQGRVSDMINRGGLKVYPDEVEEVLRSHPRVRDAGVAAIPDRRLGEVPYAWVTGAPALDGRELEAWCRERLVPYKVPVGFTIVEELPRSEIGKLLRRELAARYMEPGETVGTAEH
jgi:acyl-CoA synthetase (AMP-forming)/AMP-acid ligase II